MNTQPHFPPQPPQPGGANRLLLGNYIRQAEIGAFDEERGVEQTLRFNLSVETTAPDAPGGDDVDGILSYDTLVQTIDAVLAGERLDLLETLAERICDRLLDRDRISQVHLRIEKLDRGPFSLGIEIERSRPAAAPELCDLARAMGEAAGAPVVAVVDDEAAGQARLIEWCDALLAEGRPVILAPCPAPGAGVHATTPRRADTAAAQRQIDLLAMEQLAWTIAARDPRCRVVESRTELQYAIDKAFLAVWAPARIVRRAREPEVRDQLSGAELAKWFAGLLGAERVVTLGQPAHTSGASTAEVTAAAVPAADPAHASPPAPESAATPTSPPAPTSSPAPASSPGPASITASAKAGPLPAE